MSLSYILIALLLIHLPVLYESIFKKIKKLKIHSAKDATLSWGNIAITENEQILLKSIKEIIQKYLKSNRIKKNDWLCSALDVDILRFLRLNMNNNIESGDVLSSTLNYLLLHSKWRKSKYGIDNINKYGFDKMIFLNNYIYWLGRDINGYPTLYIKSQSHDGKYYNEDPKIFTGYIVWILENGRKKYGAKKINVILDRSPIYNNKSKNNEMNDMNMMKNLIELYKRLYSEININYPDLLNEFKIFHTSWVFNICLTIVMKIFDQTTRDKFKIYKNKNEIQNLMTAIFPNYIITNYSNNENKNNIENVYDTSYSEIYYCFN